MIRNLLFIRGGLLALLALGTLLLPEQASALLKYDLRLSDGSKNAFISATGQTVSIDLFAQVTGAVGNPATEGFQEGYGSVLSSNGGNITGNITSSLVTTYAAPGSQLGVSQTLDGDADLDLGSNLTAHSTDFFFARASSMQTTGGTPITDGVEFKIATFTFTVQSIANIFDPTSISVNFRVPVFATGIDIEGLWMEDGIGTNSNGLNGGLQPTVGSAVTISAIPEPSAFSLLAAVAIGYGLSRRRHGRVSSPNR